VVNDEIPDELLAEARQLEARQLEANAYAAHKRWLTRRNTKIRAWWCVALGYAVGAGATALMLAAMRFLP
jgi:hypothetical protein